MLTNAVLSTPKSDFKKVTDQVVLYAKQKLQLKESDFPRKLQDILAARTQEAASKVESEVVDVDGPAPPPAAPHVAPPKKTLKKLEAVVLVEDSQVG